MRKRLLPVALLTFVNTIGFSILIPVLPFVVEQYGGGALTYGLLLSAYSFFQFLAAPFIGSLSDKYGRRPTLLISQLGTFLSWILFGLAYFLPNINIWTVPLPLLVIFLSRITDGITGGNISVTNAYIADVTPAEKRTKVFGMMGAVMGIGFIVGPVLGGYTAAFSLGYLGTAIAAGAISLFTLIMIQANLTESLKPENRAHDMKIHFWTEINLYRKIKAFSSKLSIKKLFIHRVFFSFAFSSFTSTFTLYLKDFLGLDTKQIGLAMLVIGFFSIFNHAYLVHKSEKALGVRTTFNIGQLAIAISLIGIMFRPGLYGFISLMFLTNLGIAFTITTFKAMLTTSVTEKEQGRISGVDESLQAGVNGLAPMIAGALYGVLSATAFGIFASFLAIPYLIFLFLGYHKKST